MDEVKQHFNAEAREFDGLIARLIPYYQQMVEALVLAIPFERSAAVKIADLGCGTGTAIQAHRLLCDTQRHEHFSLRHRCIQECFNRSRSLAQSRAQLQSQR